MALPKGRQHLPSSGPLRAVINNLAMPFAPQALEAAAQALPEGFPPEVVDVVSDAAKDRLRGLNLPLN